MGASGTAVAQTFAIQIGFALIVFLTFSWLRLTGWARRFYAPKKYDRNVEEKPPRLPLGFFGWMTAMWNMPEAEVIRVAGLDSAMYHRVINFGWECFLKISLVVLIIILPINLTGDQVESILEEQNAPPAPSPPPPSPSLCPVPTDEIQAKKYAFSEFDKCSMSNIGAGHPKLWAHMMCVYIITFIVLTTLNRYNKEATLLRLAFLANAPKGGPSHTVLITDIPGVRHGTVSWYLRRFVGSTLFIMLPKSWRKKILDFVEEGVQTVTNLDIKKAIGGKKNTKELEELKVQPRPLDTMGKAAAYNTRMAEAAEAARNRGSGVTRRRRKSNIQIEPEDASLDPWAQAAAVLGHMDEPQADKICGFVHKEVEDTYGHGCVAAVNPVWDQSELVPLFTEYVKVRTLLDDYLNHCIGMMRRKKPIKKRRQVLVLGPTMGAWGISKYGLKAVKVDAITFWHDRLQRLVEEIEEAQHRCLEQPIPSSFVTLQTRSTQVAMCTTLHHHDESTWQIQGAPEPKEIIWPSLAMRKWERAVRSLLMWAAYVVMMLFYLVPVTAIQGLIEVPKLATYPILADIVTAPFVRQLLEGVVPGLVLIIFLAILPSILAIMCRLSGFVSLSQIDFGVTGRYFAFQVVTLFLGSLISGALLSQLKQLQANPASLITILGKAVPMTATFFINYMLVAGIGKSGIKHLRIGPLIVFKILSKAAATKRARERLWSDQLTKYGPEVPMFTIAFLLGLVYCCINPIIAPVCLIYFSFALISERYNDMFVFKREYESGGRLWFYVFNQFMVGLYFMQILMMILLAIKEFPLVPLLIPCLVITFIYHIATLILFSRPWRVMSAHDAAMLDRMDKAEEGSDHMTSDELRQIQDMYLNPVFKFRGDEIHDLLKQARIVNRKLNGEKLEDIEAVEGVDEDDEEWHSADEDESDTQTVNTELPPAPGSVASVGTLQLPLSTSARNADSSHGHADGSGNAPSVTNGSGSNGAHSTNGAPASHYTIGVGFPSVARSTRSLEGAPSEASVATPRSAAPLLPTAGKSGASSSGRR